MDLIERKKLHKMNRKEYAKSLRIVLKEREVDMLAKSASFEYHKRTPTNYLKRLPHHFFSITRSYYILENCPHMSFSNTYLMIFTQMILVLPGHIYRNHGGVSP
jgi:hypothetical protein